MVSTLMKYFEFPYLKIFKRHELSQMINMKKLKKIENIFINF